MPDFELHSALAHPPFAGGYRGARKGTVLLLGNYRPAVAVSRALQAAGYRAMLGLEGEKWGAEHSMSVAETWDHPRLSMDAGRFRRALLGLLETRRDIVAVLPVREEFVQFVARNHDAIAALCPVASPPADIIELFSAKPDCLALARDVGVPTLPFAQAGNPGELACEAAELGFPLIIRPLKSGSDLFGKKALIVDSLGELTRRFERWPRAHERLLLQKQAKGRRHNLYFFARNGEVTGHLQSVIDRTTEVDGTGFAVLGRTVTTTPEILRDTQKLTRATGYSGVGLAQFIVAGDGEQCFIELNPRISGSHAVPELSGLPLSRWAVELAGAPATESAQQTGAMMRTGLVYAWTRGDLAAPLRALARGRIGLAAALAWLGRAIRDGLRADIHMVWSGSDPLPTLFSFLTALPFWRGPGRQSETADDGAGEWREAPGK